MTKNKTNIVSRPWGKYIVLEKKPNYWLKKLFIRQGEKLSLQSHRDRIEIWIVISGKIEVTKGRSKFLLTEGDFLKINKKEKHRIAGLKDAWVLETAFGQVRETDIVRFEDDYGRA